MTVMTRDATSDHNRRGSYGNIDLQEPGLDRPMDPGLKHVETWYRGGRKSYVDIVEIQVIYGSSKSLDVPKIASTLVGNWICRVAKRKRSEDRRPLGYAKLLLDGVQVLFCALEIPRHPKMC